MAHKANKIDNYSLWLETMHSNGLERASWNYAVCQARKEVVNTIDLVIRKQTKAHSYAAVRLIREYLPVYKIEYTAFKLKSLANEARIEQSRRFIYQLMPLLKARALRGYFYLDVSKNSDLSPINPLLACGENWWTEVNNLAAIKERGLALKEYSTYIRVNFRGY